MIEQRRLLDTMWRVSSSRREELVDGGACAWLYLCTISPPVCLVSIGGRSTVSACIVGAACGESE